MKMCWGASEKVKLPEMSREKNVINDEKCNCGLFIGDFAVIIG
jgi:hypothetical protein